MSVIVSLIDTLGGPGIISIGAVARAVSQADALAIADYYGVPCVPYPISDGWLVLLPAFQGLPWVSVADTNVPSVWEVSLANSDAAIAQIAADPALFSLAYSQYLANEIINAGRIEAFTFIFPT